MSDGADTEHEAAKEKVRGIVARVGFVALVLGTAIAVIRVDELAMVAGGFALMYAAWKD